MPTREKTVKLERASVVTFDDGPNGLWVCVIRGERRRANGSRVRRARPRKEGHS